MKKIIMVLSAFLLSGCMSPSTPVNAPDVKYEVTTFMPEMDFPSFPNIGEVEALPDGRYAVSRQYLLSLAQYRLEIEALEKYYNKMYIIYNKN